MTENELRNIASPDWQVSKNEEGQTRLTHKDYKAEETRSQVFQIRIKPSIKKTLADIAKKQGISSADLIEYALSAYFKEVADVDKDIEEIDELLYTKIKKWECIEEHSDREKKLFNLLNSIYDQIQE